MNFSSLVTGFGIFGMVSGFFISLWASFKYLLLNNYKLNNEVSKRLFDNIKAKSSFSWVITSELVWDPKYPSIFESFNVMGGIPFFFSRGERLFTAGWESKESVSSITFFRWHQKKVDRLLTSNARTSEIAVSALTPGGQDRIGALNHDPNPEIYLSDRDYKDIEQDVQRVVKGDILKTSFLLHGSPGNGKTQFVKYLSKKYSLPINIVHLQSNYTNLDIIRMFAELPRNCIVLFEDFDNYFDGRQCTIQSDEIRFTFDSFINSLDGVHNDYRGVIFAMTANDIKKIDASLSSRPSRFKFVREFGPPCESVRRKIFDDDDFVRMTDGKSLDQVFALKDANVVSRS